MDNRSNSKANTCKKLRLLEVFIRLKTIACSRPVILESDIIFSHH